MKKRNLSLSLLIGATLTIPSLAMAAPADTAQADMQTAQADMQTASANDAVETDVENSNSAQGATQSNPFVINETQRISRASAGNIAAAQQAMPADLQAQQQQDMQLQVEPQDMQDQDAALVQEQDAQEAMLQEEEMMN